MFSTDTPYAAYALCLRPAASLQAVDVGDVVLEMDRSALILKISALLDYESSQASLKTPVLPGYGGSQAGACLSSSVTRFHSSTLPSISVKDYLERISSYIPSLENVFFLCILLYIERLKQASFSVDRLMLHRFIACVLCVSSKFFFDCYYSNSFYAKVCGVSCKELNTLEVELLSLLNWNLSCSGSEILYLLERLKGFDCNV